MPFARDQISDLLCRCHRRCCICHRFCGIKIETDHIVPTDERGSDDIDNAIPVCFECHAEIHSYNDRHPRGRKFLPDELRAHKAQWLKICDEHPGQLLSAIRDADVGPLQALIDELYFNERVADPNQHSKNGVVNEHNCRFHESQFLRAIHEGAISMLREEIREQLLTAYRAIGAANGAIEAKSNHEINSEGWANGTNAVNRLMTRAYQEILTAKCKLSAFLSSERDAG